MCSLSDTPHCRQLRFDEEYQRQLIDDSSSAQRKTDLKDQIAEWRGNGLPKEVMLKAEPAHYAASSAFNSHLQIEETMFDADATQAHSRSAKAIVDWCSADVKDALEFTDGFGTLQSDVFGSGSSSFNAHAHEMRLHDRAKGAGLPGTGPADGIVSKLWSIMGASWQRTTLDQAQTIGVVLLGAAGAGKSAYFWHNKKPTPLFELTTDAKYLKEWSTLCEQMLAQALPVGGSAYLLDGSVLPGTGEGVQVVKEGDQAGSTSDDPLTAVAANNIGNSSASVIYICSVRSFFVRG
jgi:hypothetical protein